MEWDPVNAQPRKIKVRVQSVDKPGLLNQVTSSISSAGINISSANVTTSRDQRATQIFDLWVTDVRTLNSVMQAIERIKGVISVERVRT